MKSLRDQIKGRCVHSTNRAPGRIKESYVCGADVNYYEHMRIKELGYTGCMLRLPCFGNTGSTRGIAVIPCSLYQPPTEEAIQAEIASVEEAIDCMKKGLSRCCKAPVDESQIIKEGQYKGHGRRFCSACHKCVSMA